MVIQSSQKKEKQTQIKNQKNISIKTLNFPFEFSSLTTILINSEELIERKKAVVLLEKLFTEKEFAEISQIKRYIKKTFLPELKKIPTQPLSVRKNSVVNLAEIIFKLKTYLSTSNIVIQKTFKEKFEKKIDEIYAMKYPKFGTSGIRGVWEKEFTKQKIEVVTQSICDFIKHTGNQNKPIIIGYDSRLHANKVAEWAARICVTNKLKVMLTNRDTPTPVLAFFAVEVLGEENNSGIINCTSSHNPVQWHGFKYSLPNGQPAPSKVTSWIELRANELQLSKARKSKIKNNFLQKNNNKNKKKESKITVFDPKNQYCKWVLSKPKEYALDIDSIKKYFKNKLIVVDEMYGSSRGYFPQILGVLGLKFIVVHGEKNPVFGELKSANPEEKQLEKCKKTVIEHHAELGFGMDSDADRFGVINEQGQFVTANQIIAMMADHLINNRKYKGKIGKTLTTTNALDRVANNPLVEKPSANALPLYLTDKSYEVKIGSLELFKNKPVFETPVGMKHITDVMWLDENYQKTNTHINAKIASESIIIGGEDSGGLTTKGHLAEKDGIWANLNVLEFVAVNQKPLSEIWVDFQKKFGKFYSKRIDFQLNNDAKDKLINNFLDIKLLQNKKSITQTFNPQLIAGQKIVFLGGVRFDLVQIVLVDGNNQNSYLIIRVSGTEPLSRIYIESPVKEHIVEIESVITELIKNSQTNNKSINKKQ